jgi:hypothetical protein
LQYQLALAIVTVVLLGAWFAFLRKKRNFWKIAVINTILTYILAASFPYVSLQLSMRSVIILYDAIILIVVVATDRLIAYNKKLVDGIEEGAAQQAVEMTADSAIAAVYEDVARKQEPLADEQEFIGKAETGGVAPSNDKPDSLQLQRQDYEPDKEIEQIIDKAVAEVIAEKTYGSISVPLENETEQKPSRDIKEESTEIKIQDEEIDEEVKELLQLEPKEEDSLITKIEIDEWGAEEKAAEIQRENKPCEPCECKDTLGQAAEGTAEDEEAVTAELDEGIQAGLPALNVQEDIISGGESIAAEEETTLQAEVDSEDEADSEKPCECKDTLGQAAEGTAEDEEAVTAEPAEGIPGEDRTYEYEAGIIEPEPAIIITNASDVSAADDSPLEEMTEEYHEQEALAADYLETTEQKEDTLATKPPLVMESSLPLETVEDRNFEDNETQVLEILEEKMKALSLFEEIDEDEHKQKSDGALTVEPEFHKEHTLEEPGLDDEPVSDITTGTEGQILEISEEKAELSSLFEETEDEAEGGAYADFSGDITITAHKDEGEITSTLQDIAPESLLADIKEETAEQKPGIIAKTDDWDSILGEINEEGDEQEKLIEEIFASDMETKDSIGETSVSEYLKEEIGKEDVEKQQEIEETMEEVPVDKVTEIFGPMVIKAFALKEQGDILEAIKHLESILRLNPPGDLAYLIFEEFEILYQKI